jgi:hypothetical protein
VGHATDTAEYAKRDVAQTSARLHKKGLRLEAKIDRLALISQALWELVRAKADLCDKDIEARIAEIDARDGRIDGRITGRPANCPKCARPVHTRHRVCLYCGAAVHDGHLVEKP